MPLALASQLGPYQILGLLGAGAMGEVYRARDTRLGRDVAIKVVQPGSTDRSHRFEQEARAASGVSHPNILTVYDVGHQDGAAYIVSELVDGESLRAVVQRGPVPVRGLLDIAVQIAEGLAAAHEAGIVHRDLKPENVMITRDGRVKLLDFGLAKAVLENAASGAEEQLGNEETAQGVLLGTTPYMSPEQARGLRVGIYSDQFSLGAILYEMATGKPLFRRDTALDTLTAIVTEPVPPLAVGPMLFRWVVMRCLHKEPDHRYAATADIARELRNARDHLTEPGVPETPTVLAEQPAPDERSHRFSPVAAQRVLVLLAAVAAGFALAHLLGGTAGTADRLDFRPFSSAAGLQVFPAWSPGGNTLAYAADDGGLFQIMVRSTSSSMATQLTRSSADCYSPFWSPDGDRVYYVSDINGKPGLWSVSAAGGTPQVVLQNVIRAAVSPDGRTLAALRPDERSLTALWLGPADGTALRRYDSGPLAGKRALPWSYLAFAPDGRSLGVWLSLADGTSELWRIPLPSGTAKRMLPDLPGSPLAREFAWMPDSRRIVYADRTELSLGSHLWIADTRNGALHAISNGSGNELSPSVTPDGRQVAFAATTLEYDVVEMTLAGGIRPVLHGPAFEASPARAPNGDILYVTDRSGTPGIWLRSAGGTLDRPIVTAAQFRDRTLFIFDTVFSPDGRRFAFRRAGSSDESIWIATLTGSPPVRLARQPGHEIQRGPSWSPDGNSLVYFSLHGGHYVLMTARVGAIEPPRVIAEGAGTYPRWSPDGVWIACIAPDEGISFVTPDGKKQKDAGSGAWLVHGWSDKKTVVGVRREGRRLTVSAIDVDTGEQRTLADLGAYPAAYSYANVLGTMPLDGFSMEPERSAFLTSVVHPASDIWIVADRPQSKLAAIFSKPFAR